MQLAEEMAEIQRNLLEGWNPCPNLAGARCGEVAEVLQSVAISTWSSGQMIR